MKEAFELIRKRLEKLLGDTNFEKATQEVNESFYDGLAYAYGEALSIVSEVEAEYGKDVCEWKNEEGMFIQNPHTGRKFSNEPSMMNVYCNTCGKKIKVVGELPEAYQPTTD